MPFNDILVEAGGFGRFQKYLTYGYLTLSLTVVSFTFWIQIFILLIPPHRCKIFDNDTQWIKTFSESDHQKADACRIQSDENFTNCKLGMVYDFSINFPTYASENNLVCENAWKMYLAHTIFFIGTIFGTIFFGIFNDRFGRRRAYQYTVALTLLSDVMTYFCVQLEIFLLARFCSALGASSIPSISILLVIEHTIPSKRKLNIFVWSVAYAFSSLIIVWLAYFVYNWRYLLIIAWIPPSIAIIISFFLPESPSWLITKGRVEEAADYIEKMARINGKTLSKDFILYHLQSANKKLDEKGQLKPISQSIEKTNSINEVKKAMSGYQTFLAVMKSPNLRKRILCLGFLAMVTWGCYNGGNLVFNYLPYNMYITYSIGAIMELPGCIFIMLALDRFGRRWSGAGIVIIGGIFGIVSANIESKIVIISLVMVMRMCYSSAYDITSSMSSELVPTEIRGRAFAFIRTCGGIGNSLAPFVVSLAEKDALLPLSCFGIVAILAGLVTMTLPETTNEPLPQTIEEGENFGKGQSFWYCPFIRRQHENKKEPTDNSHLESFANPAYETEENQVQCVRIQKLPTD